MILPSNPPFKALLPAYKHCPRILANRSSAVEQCTALQAAILPRPDAVCLPLLPRLVLSHKMSHDAAASGGNELGSGAGYAPADLPGPCQARAALSGGPSSAPQDEMAACTYTSSLLGTTLPLGFLPCFSQVCCGPNRFGAVAAALPSAAAQA